MKRLASPVVARVIVMYLGEGISQQSAFREVLELTATILVRFFSLGLGENVGIGIRVGVRLD